MLFSLLLTLLPPTWGQETVSSTDRSCSQQEVCTSRTSCRYWLDRENKFKEGRDPSYITDARAQICNKQRNALCCPQDPLDLVSSPDRSCSQQEVCATKTSCQYWLDRETKFKAGQDPGYITDAKAQACNKQRRALCCPRESPTYISKDPLNAGFDSPTFIPKVGQCGLNPEAPDDSKSSFVFGGNNTNPGDFPFSALLGFIVVK